MKDEIDRLYAPYATALSREEFVRRYARKNPQFADRLYKEFYSGQPRERFNEAIGVKNVSRGSAAALGVADGVTLNSTDEIAGAAAALANGALKPGFRRSQRGFLGAGLDAESRAVLDRGLPELEESAETTAARRAAVEKVRSIQTISRRERPVSYGLGQVAGAVAPIALSLATAPATGGAATAAAVGNAGKSAASLATGLRAAGRPVLAAATEKGFGYAAGAAKAAAGGGAYGAAAALGDQRGDLLERLENGNLDQHALAGAIGGAGLHGLLTGGATAAKALINGTKKAVARGRESGAAQRAYTQAVEDSNFDFLAAANREVANKNPTNELARGFLNEIRNADVAGRVRGEQTAATNKIRDFARDYGIELTGAEIRGDQAGLHYLYDAASGASGAGAQREALAILAPRGQSFASALRSTAPGTGDDAAEAARRALGEKAVELATKEDAAFARFRNLARKGEFRRVNNSSIGIKTLQSRINARLNDEFIDLSSPAEAGLFRRSANLVRRIDEEVAREAQGASTPVERIEAVRRLINNTIDGAVADPSDQRIATIIKHAFNDYLEQDVPNIVRATGREAADALSDALAASRKYRGTFHSPVIEKLLSPETSPQQAFAQLFGAGNGINARPGSVSALQRLKSVVGEDHETIRNIQAVAIQKLTGGLEAAVRSGQPPPISQTAERIRSFLKNEQELANELFTPTQLSHLSNIEEIMRFAQTPRRSATSPGSGDIVARQFAGAALNSTPAGATLNSVFSELRNLRAAGRIRRELRNTPPKSLSPGSLIGAFVRGAISDPIAQIPRPAVIGGAGGVHASGDLAPRYYEEDVYGTTNRR